MCLFKEDLAVAKACLQQVSSDLARLEQRILSKQTTPRHRYTREVSDLCAQVQSAVAQISAMDRPEDRPEGWPEDWPEQVAASPSTADPDRCWFALKTAIQTYRKTLSTRSNSNATHEI